MSEQATKPLGGTSGPKPTLAANTPSRWLAGVDGTLRFVVRDATVLAITVKDGDLRIAKGGDPADTTVLCGSEDDVNKLVHGEINPVIMALLGRLEIEGDIPLGLQVLHALRDAEISLAGSADHAA